MRRAIAGLVLLLCTSAGHAEQTVVQFPGPVEEARAPNSDLRVTYIDPGENADKIHENSLRLEYPGGRSDEIDVFTRSVNVSWSPSGEALFVTDFIGSNVADCYVITPGSKNTIKTSLTDVVTQNRFPAVVWSLQHSDHGYTVCDGWEAPDRLHFTVYGDIYPNSFRYAFTYDVRRGVATQVRSSSKKHKPSR